MKKALIIVLIVAAVAGGAYWLLKEPSDTADESGGSTQPTQINTETPAATAEEVTVTYDGSTFSPATVTVKPGTKVNFKNQSTRPMWVASDPHPVHTNLDGFDADKGFVQGETYSFTFTEKGSWGYHNHLDSGKTGTVVVE